MTARLKALAHMLARKKWWLLSVAAVLFVLVVGPSVFANLSTGGLRYSPATVPEHKVAIVFGAGVYPDGTPTPYLQKRLQMAAALYKAGHVHLLLLTGDNSTTHHNEPVVMRTYVEHLGVPAKDIVLDYAGFNTYDSCYRAHAIFGVTSAVLVSHGYHLPRAIMTCRALGVESVGVAADGGAGRQYSVNYLVRELGSTDKAALQVIFKPQPTVLGRAEPIK